LLPHDEAECLSKCEYYCPSLPGNNMDDPPAIATTDDPERMDESLQTIIPDSPKKAYDMKEVMKALWTTALRSAAVWAQIW
jgi:acetyl-CoA carboxylase carboxyltransferase component